MMELLGVNWSYLLLQILVFGIWPILTLIALFRLRRRSLTASTQFLWVLLILVAPIFGALTFFILKPGNKVQT